jgi:hypothetical protein
MGIVRRGLMIFQSTKKDTQIEYQASFLLFGNSAQKKWKISTPKRVTPPLGVLIIFCFLFFAPYHPIYPSSTLT